MLAVLLAMINLPDLDPDPIKTPAATIGQRLSGSGNAVDAMLGAQPAFGDVQIGPACTYGALPLTQNLLGDLSTLSRTVTTPTCLPDAGRFGGWLASPSSTLPFGGFAPVVLPIFGSVRSPGQAMPHFTPPTSTAFPSISRPAPDPARWQRGLESPSGPGAWHRGETVTAPGGWHQTLESPAMGAQSHGTARAAQARPLR